MSLQQRIKKIEVAAQPMIEVREKRINAYIAECKKCGVEITRKEAAQAHEFFTSEMARLEHLPVPERRKQAAHNLSVNWYRQKTGASEDEAIAALKPLIPGLCKA